MSESPGLPSAVGIEAVQWLPGSGENVTVRVRGRWRRGRPNWSGQPLLVIEADGRRQRFPAMPEPPSLTGTAPGTWQISFSVPASLAAAPDAKAWLQLGGAMIAPIWVPEKVWAAAAPEGSPATVEEELAAGESLAVDEPLPVGELRGVDEAYATSAGSHEAPDEVTTNGVLAERQLHSAERAAEAARRRAHEAETATATLEMHVEMLEQALEDARREPERLATLLAQREREKRAAEQRAHAEHALQVELAEQLAARGGGPVGHLATALERIGELEEELARVRRAADEAEHVARAAIAARQRAERRLQELADRPAPVPTPTPAPTPTPQPAARAGPDARMRAVLAALRGELDQLRVAAERESAGRVVAEARADALAHELLEHQQRAVRAFDAIERVRAQLVAWRTPGSHAPPGPDPPAAEPDPAAAEPDPAAVDPERFGEALARLRAGQPPPVDSPVEAPAPEQTVPKPRGWFGRLFGRRK